MGQKSNSLRVAIVIGVAGLVMMGVFRIAGWYADTAALPRYCEDPRGALQRVGRILTESAPAGSEKRRPYIVAAKLIFLVPQEDEEKTPDYLERLNHEISARCQVVY